MLARRHHDWRWLSAGLLLLAQGGVLARATFEVMEVEGRVEQATGPAELQRLDAEDRVGVRALIGFGRLPEPIQAGPIGADWDREPIAPATPVAQPTAPFSSERIWSSAGMRVFDHRRPDLGPSLETEAAGLAVMPDAGYVVAGSVQGPGGREVWAARFDANQELLWSRMLGGAFDLHITAVTTLGEGDLLIGGVLNDNQAGFLIALDAQGEPRWTQVLGGSENTAVEVPLALATDTAGNALIAGETLNADRPPQGFAALIAADGQPGWRLALPATSGVRSVIRTDTGWSIAGESAGISGAPWVAGLDPTGHLTWERTYEDLAGRGAPVLAGLGDDGIVLAVRGAEGDGDPLWLRWLSPDGEPLSTRRLSLVVGEQDGIATLTRLTRDAEGALWLAGMTQGQDAWIARLSHRGEALWTRRYGRAALDRFTDLYVQPEGPIAIGFTQSEDSDATGLWVVMLDATGQPRPAPEDSPAADAMIARLASSLASLDDEVQIGGAPLISHQPDGRARVALPFLRIEDEAGILDLSWLDIALTRGADPNAWQAAIGWPETLTLRNGDGNEIGTVRTARHRLELDWPAPDALPTRLDFSLEGLQVHIDGQARLQPIHEALGLPQGPSSLESDDTDLGLVTLGRLQLLITPESAPEAARTTASQSLELADLRLRSRSGADTVQLGGLRVNADYRDLDLAALTTGDAPLLELIASDTETPDIETLRRTLERLLQASGQVETSVVMTDFAADLPSEDIDYRIAEFSVSAQGGPADEAGRSWNLRTGYGLRGLRMEEDGQDNRIGAFSVDLAIDRLALAALLDIVLTQALGQPPAESSLAQALGQPLAGAKLGLAIDALHVATPDAPAVDVDAMHVALDLSDATGPRPRLTLRYDHTGIGPIPELPPELVPGKVDLDLVLSGLAPSTLVPVLLQGEPDPAQILGLLAQQAARLDIETIDIDMSGTGVRIRGVANAEETSAPEAPGLIRLNLDIQVRDFATLIERIGQTLPPDKQRNLKAVAALVKILGKEEKDADGSRLHRFEVRGDSAGEFKVNGKDLKPILDALQ